MFGRYTEIVGALLVLLLLFVLALLLQGVIFDG